MVQLTRRSLLRMLATLYPASGLRGALGASLVQSAAPGAAGGDLFEKLTPEKTGIHWSHSNGRTAEYYLPETTGGGCAFVDYDNDGWMDIYLVNSGKCDFLDPQPPLRNALYKNNRDGTFTDVTEKAGVGGGGYGMGVAVGDYDNDGFPDLFVSQYGRGILYHNNGDGTFSDVTEKSGLLTVGWGSSAVWFDYDNDGKLDLFVCRFVEFDKSKNQFCGDAVTRERYYCYPKIYPPTKSWLFHNNGDGTFRDVSEESGIAKVLGKGWGVVAADVNNDGWMDLYVANDTVQNFLFINNKGKFKESALDADVAFSMDGRVRSGMGVDAADYDNDGYEDLFVTNVDQEMYSLYHNVGDGTFEDVASRYGIGRTTRLMSGWGVKFFDYDNDGNVDLIVGDGHPDDKIENHSAHVTYREPMLLFHNNGKGFENVSAMAGSAFSEPIAARGLAVGDFNNDGAVDVLVAVNNGAPVLLKNTVATANHWLGVRLIGKNCNRDAVGARIKWRSGDFERSVSRNGGGSYLASHDPRLVLGIGAREKIDRLEITWPAPSGKVEVLSDLPIDQYITIVEGKGIKQA
jgi:enediyne biosynthesis protein E4